MRYAVMRVDTENSQMEELTDSFNEAMKLCNKYTNANLKKGIFSKHKIVSCISGQWYEPDGTPAKGPD